MKKKKEESNKTKRKKKKRTKTRKRKNERGFLRRRGPGRQGGIQFDTKFFSLSGLPFLTRPFSPLHLSSSSP
jgi:hypothetical protein